MGSCRHLVLAAVLPAILSLGACGGGNDKEEAEKVVREIAEARTEGDAEKVCSLATEKLLRQSTGASGDKAKEACEKQVKATKRRETKVTKITQTEVKGDTATVTVELETQGVKRPQVFTLKKEDGEFRLTGANE